MDHPELPHPLPDDLYWLDADVRPLQRPVAFATSQRQIVALPPGSTRRGSPDIPADAHWARGATTETFCCHHQDGPSCVLQLNLADIPETVRRPEWPRVGMLWVFLESDRRNIATVEFDPRPPSEIVWRANPRPKGYAQAWSVGVSLPWRTETILPVLWNWKGMGDLYDDYVQEKYLSQGGRGLTVGGWGFTNQGDFDEDSKEFVLAIEDLEFGDSGEVYVFFNTERGFYARADIC